MKVITLKEINLQPFGYAFAQGTFTRSTNAHNHNHHDRLGYP
jgi:hypothetical protein